MRWFLSVDASDLPQGTEGRAFRSLIVSGQEIDLSGGFEDLHTKSYAQILSGNGFRIRDARPSIELAYRIRTSSLSKPEHGVAHPMLKL